MDAGGLAKEAVLGSLTIIISGKVDGDDQIAKLAATLTERPVPLL
jgi:hypothetical protein